MRLPHLSSHRFVLAQGSVIFLVWLLALGPAHALAVLADFWRISLTMVFGSMVAGGTGEGGGAIAFPILTKLLHVPAEEARVFSLAIQSVGMTAASLALIQRRAAVEWEVVVWASLGGAVGMILGAVFLAPLAAPQMVRVGFTMMQVALGVVLLILRNRAPREEGRWRKGGWHQNSLLLTSGLVGGVLSALLGTGISIVLFSVMVVYCRVSEKIALPTAVILVSPNSLVGFATYGVLGGVDSTVFNFWLAAVPVAALAAPIGAIICSQLSRKIIVYIIVTLIVLEFLTTLIVIPMNTVLVAAQTAMFVVFLLFYLAMERLGRSHCPLEGKALPW